ncbi:histone H2A-like [Phyllobates terribilis]|uniref:histone H2A-like n=1 Tax=Phyllobates terribilis TaxID=111132 RepID=UPI003CCACD10
MFRRGGNAGNPKRPKSGSSRAGLHFPVGRIHGRLCEELCNVRVSTRASVCMAAVLQYVTAELLEAAGNTAQKSKTYQITPAILQYAVRNDTELNRLLANVDMRRGGLPPDLMPSRPSCPAGKSPR